MQIKIDVAKRPVAGDTITIRNATANIVETIVYEFTHKNRPVQSGNKPILIRRSNKDMERDLRKICLEN